VGDELLGAVDHPAIAVADRRRAHRARITAGRSLGESPGSKRFATSKRREISSLLFVGAEHRDMRGAQPVVRRHGERDRWIDPRELLDTDAVVDRGHRRSAELLRKLNSHQAEFGKLREQGAREFLRLVPFANVRPQLGLRELAYAAPQQFLIGTEFEIHRG
jgi:hypothetical protein